MAVSDLCRSFGSELLPLMDVGGAAQPLKSLLSQLLLKVRLKQCMHVLMHALSCLKHASPSTLCCSDLSTVLDSSSLLPKPEGPSMHTKCSMGISFCLQVLADLRVASCPQACDRPRTLALAATKACSMLS